MRTPTLKPHSLARTYSPAPHVHPHRVHFFAVFVILGLTLEPLVHAMKDVRWTQIQTMGAADPKYTVTIRGSPTCAANDPHCVGLSTLSIPAPGNNKLNSGKYSPSMGFSLENDQSNTKSEKGQLKTDDMNSTACLQGQALDITSCSNSLSATPNLSCPAYDATNRYAFSTTPSQIESNFRTSMLDLISFLLQGFCRLTHPSFTKLGTLSNDRIVNTTKNTSNNTRLHLSANSPPPTSSSIEVPSWTLHKKTPPQKKNNKKK